MGGGGGGGDLENFAYLWKNPGYAPVSDIVCRLLVHLLVLSSFPFLFQKLRSDPRHSEVGFKVGMVMRHKL